MLVRNVHESKSHCLTIENLQRFTCSYIYNVHIIVIIIISVLPRIKLMLDIMVCISSEEKEENILMTERNRISYVG